MFCLSIFYNFSIFSGISTNWEGYPIEFFFTNIVDGYNCFLGNGPDESGYDTSDSICSYSYFLVLGYVISNILVLECIDIVLRARKQILERSMTAAVLVAFFALAIYDNDFGQDSHGIDFQNILALIVLLIGMEIYGRDPEPDAESLTAFVP